jgi:hypothetical protein
VVHAKSEREAFSAGMPIMLRFLLLLLVAGAAQAQTGLLEGVVVDARSEQPLPGATLQTLSGSASAVAGRDGRFRLRVPGVPVQIVVRRVGFRSDTIQVRSVARLTIRMEPAPIALGGVNVSGEDPAMGIMRRVLERKAELAQARFLYGASLYGRLLVEKEIAAGRLPVRLAEYRSLLHAQVGRGAREEVVARRRVPAGGPLRFADADALPDVSFEDLLVIDGGVYLSPTHPEAVGAYGFRLGSQWDSLGVGWAEMSFRPSERFPRGVRPLFGRLVVSLADRMIVEAELRPVDDPPLPGVDVFAGSYHVWYARAFRDVWLPARYERQAFLTVSGAGVRLPPLHLTQRVWIVELRPGEAAPDATWARADRFYSPPAYGPPDVFAASRLRHPLASAEAVADTSLVGRTLEGLLPQRGMGIGLPFVGAINKIELEGEDDG